MADEQNQNEVTPEEGGGQDDEAQETKTYDSAQVDELVKKAKSETAEEMNAKMEEMNAKFQKQLSEIKKEKEAAVQDKKSYEEQTREMVDNLRREGAREKLLSQAIKTYNQAGIDVPDDEVLLDMIREESDDPLRIVKHNVEMQQTVAEKQKAKDAEEFAKKHGRTVTQTDKSNGTGTFDDYTPDQVKTMPADEYEKVFQRTYGSK